MDDEHWNTFRDILDRVTLAAKSELPDERWQWVAENLGDEGAENLAEVLSWLSDAYPQCPDYEE